MCRDPEAAMLGDIQVTGQTESPQGEVRSLSGGQGGRRERPQAEGTTDETARRGDQPVKTNHVLALCWVPGNTEVKNTKSNPATT